jgi:cytosine/adenosine deaminase-related metal-dependent hydrolase
MKQVVINARLQHVAELQNIVIEDGIIREVGESCPDDADVFNASGNLVISGIVNAHAHFDKSLLIDRKRYVDELPPVRAGWVREMKQDFTVEDITARARRLLDASVERGIIGVRTNVDVDTVVGVKGVEALLALKAEYREKLDFQVVAFSQEGFLRYPETRDLLAEALILGADSVGGHTSIDATAKQQHIDILFSIAQRRGVNIDFHADETGREDDHMLPYLIEKTKAAGYQGKVNAVHCCSLAVISPAAAQNDIAGLADAGIKVIVCPTAIATRQLTDIKGILAAGCTVGLGTDNIQDLFNPLGNGDMFDIGRLLTFVKRFYTDAEQQVVFEMLTTGGAAFVDIERFAIKPGNKASLSILGFSNPADIYRADKQLVKRIS